MVTWKRVILVAVLLCTASLLVFHFSSRIFQSLPSDVVGNSLLGSKGLSGTPLTSSPKNGTNSAADPASAVERPTSAVKLSTPAVKISPPPVKISPPAVVQSKEGCSCDSSEFHFVSMDEFKSVFAQHNGRGFPSLHTKYINDSYTVIIPCYKRDNAIPTHLAHFCKAPHVHKILFLWHNTERPVPSKFIGQSCGVPYKFITPKKNSLSNRFILWEEIETEAVFTIDDDTSENYETLNTGFEAWKAYPHLLVGYISRTHEVVKGRYHYYDGPTCYSMILTTAAFVHRKYMEIYSSPEMEKLRKFIDDNMNGEDIVMNGIVANYLRRSGMDFTPACHSMLIEGGRKELFIPGAGYSGIYRRPGHQEKRDKCVNLLADFFDALPFTCCHYHVKNPLGVKRNR